MNINSLVLSSTTSHIFHFHTSDFHDFLPYFYKLLSNEEQERASEFLFSKDKICYILSKGVLRILLSSYLHILPIELQFAYTNYGKPYLLNNSSLKFNV